MDQATKAQKFAALHVGGSPLIIYNVWDGATAKALASIGAEVIATGDHPVGYSHGYGDDDFNDFSFDTYLATIKEIVKRAGDLPVSIDISNGADLDEAGLRQRVQTVIEAGAVGINFEDTTDDGSSLRPIDDQAARIAAIRAAAEELSVPVFINARSDLFALAGSAAPRSLLDAATERARAYKAAGANGFFVPGLMDRELIAELCKTAPLPLNIIRLPGAPTTQELASAGVARVSYGPVPQMQMIEWFKAQARQALDGTI